MSGQARQELETIARRWVVEGWQRGNLDAVLAMYAPDFVDLSHPSGRIGTREDNVRGIVDLYAAFPDFVAETEFLIVDETAGRVAVRWTARGTHRGTYFGIEATGRPVLFHGVETLKIENGLIVERTGEWDAIEILQQMGVRLWMG